MAEKRKIMIVAGEASGDSHAARLVNALRAAVPDGEFEFFGSAGVRMREAGVEAVVRADDIAIVGLLEIARALPMFLRAFRTLKKAAEIRRPDAVVLVDFPDFNLKLAKSLKKMGLRVVYYISPQLWGWRKYRRHTIRDYVDLLLAILPFEKDWYAGYGIENVEYVGSPLVREVHPSISGEEFRAKHSIAADRPLIALLPGSRHKEIIRILPSMLETAAKMAEKNQALQFVVALAANRNRDEVTDAVSILTARGIEPPKGLFVVHDETYDALNAADAAAVASGTATLETGIIGTPMAIVYKTSALNYKLLRPLIDVEHFGLINLIAGERVAKELIQHEFTAETLSAELFRLLETQTNSEVRSRLHDAVEKLGHGGASKRAAEAFLRLLRER